MSKILKGVETPTVKKVVKKTVTPVETKTELPNDPSVTTVSGKTVPQSSCVEIKGIFYQKGVDIIKVGDVFYRASLTVKDEATGNYQLKEGSKLHVVLTNTGKIGYSSVYKNVVIQVGSLPSGVSLDKLSYKNVGSSGDLVTIKVPSTGLPASAELKKFLKIEEDVHISSADWKKLTTTVFPAVKDNNRKYYSVTNHPDFEELCKGKYPTSSKYDFVTNKYTYGFELETSAGQFMVNQPEDFGFMTLYDGSISGHEYASVPFVPAQFKALEDFCGALQKNHLTNKFCSVHVHVGGVPYSQEILMALYSLFYRLQDELHSIVSPFKKDLKFLSNKLRGEAKDHCQYLPKLPTTNIENFNSAFFRWAGMDIKDYRTTKSAKILSETQKWNVESRYFFVNFTNYCFKENGTIELRLLQGSLNADRILNWTLINSAVIEYAVANVDKIMDARDKIFLEDCINAVYPAKVAKTLNDYITEVTCDNFNYRVQKDMKSDDKYFVNERIANTL